MHCCTLKICMDFGPFKHNLHCMLKFVWILFCHMRLHINFWHHSGYPQWHWPYQDGVTGGNDDWESHRTVWGPPTSSVASQGVHKEKAFRRGEVLRLWMKTNHIKTFMYLSVKVVCAFICLYVYLLSICLYLSMYVCMSVFWPVHLSVYTT